MNVKMNFNPGLKKAGLDPNMVQQLIDVQKIPIENMKQKIKKVESEKAEYEKLNGLMTELNTSLNGLKTKTDFYKLVLNSSHPDIIEGTVQAGLFWVVMNSKLEVWLSRKKNLHMDFQIRMRHPLVLGLC